MAKEKTPEGRAIGKFVQPYIREGVLGSPIGKIMEDNTVRAMCNDRTIGYVENDKFYRGKPPRN